MGIVEQLRNRCEIDNDQAICPGDIDVLVNKISRAASVHCTPALAHVYAFTYIEMRGPSVEDERIHLA
jgi:hypothetical protein